MTIADGPINRQTPRCSWCEAHPGETHKDDEGQPLYSLTHHAGRWVDEETDRRISSDGQ